MVTTRLCICKYSVKPLAIFCIISAKALASLPTRFLLPFNLGLKCNVFHMSSNHWCLITLTQNHAALFSFCHLSRCLSENPLRCGPDLCFLKNLNWQNCSNGVPTTCSSNSRKILFSEVQCEKGEEKGKKSYYCSWATYSTLNIEAKMKKPTTDNNQN